MDELPRIRKESGVFWIEADKVKPNSMQPRREFDEEKLKELAESIRQYGVLQPLVVIRKETEVPTGTLVEYELIAGERRLRASKIAGLDQVPVIIRDEPSEKIKLELALIENLQREDLGPFERALAFKQLVDDFKMRHHEVGAKMGKSREFVSNTIRLLSLPPEIQDGLRQGLINEGHTRPLLSLTQQPEDQFALYKEIIYRKISVREAESISRKLVKERVLRKVHQRSNEDPDAKILEDQISGALGTRVTVERRGTTRRISIDFFSEEELNNFLSRIAYEKKESAVPVSDDAFSEERIGTLGESNVVVSDAFIEDAPSEKTTEETVENFTV
ncbi:MAG: ParB/RepB/Spo0J family partition protein [bacterium]|nr:ParB/RepB/Spo0J family partition protein [bacterium]